LHSPDWENHSDLFLNMLSQQAYCLVGGRMGR
jgi:hypothetical protein